MKSGLFDFEISPSKQWIQLREQFREANLKRIRQSLRPHTIPVWKIISIFDDKMQKCGRFAFITGYKETGFLVNAERHTMEDLPPEIPPEAESLAAKLLRQAKDALTFDVLQVAPESGLPSEDYDGPPIYDLENEDEILAAIDKMKQRGERE